MHGEPPIPCPCRRAASGAVRPMSIRAGVVQSGGKAHFTRGIPAPCCCHPDRARRRRSSLAGEDRADRCRSRPPLGRPRGRCRPPRGFWPLTLCAVSRYVGESGQSRRRGNRHHNQRHPPRRFREATSPGGGQAHSKLHRKRRRSGRRPRLQSQCGSIIAASSIHLTVAGVLPV